MSNPTEATAPDTTPTDTSAADQTAAAAVTTTEGGEGGAAAAAEPPKLDPEAAALAAFDKGLEQSGTAPRTAADVAAKAAASPAPAPAATAPAGAPAPAAAPAAAKTPEPDPETDKAVKELGLKGRAEERFREMAETIKDSAPLREVLSKHQLTDPAKVEEVIESAARAQEWENTVLASTATPDQFGMALNVIKAMNSGDPKVMGVAFDTMLEQVVTLGRQLGREVPGLVDPLQAHPDLQEEVKEGDITRKRALEIAAQRATTAQLTERDTKRATDNENTTALQQAGRDIDALNTQLKAADPDFARKLPLLQPTLDVIRTTMHPSRWAEAIAAAYAKLPPLPRAAAPAPAPAPAPARPPVGHMPVRPGGINAGMQVKPRSDLEAFELGLKSLTRD